MTRTRAAALVGGLVALLLAAVAPAAAQSSLNEELIQGLNLKLLYVAIPITVLVEVILVYTVVRYKDNEDPSPTRENRRLEITWTVATAFILLFVGFAAYQVLGVTAIGGVTAASVENPQEPATTHDYEGAVGPPQSEQNAVQVEVVASKYSWTFNYPNETVQGNDSKYVSSTGTLVIPADRPVYLHVTSTDWLHSFHVPQLSLKQDAFPHQYNTISTVAYEKGSYQLYCAEYCGVGHSTMLGQVDVVSNQKYQQWLDEQKASMKGSGGNATAGNASAGNGSAGNQSAGNQSSVASP